MINGDTIIDCIDFDKLCIDGRKMFLKLSEWHLNEIEMVKKQKIDGTCDYCGFKESYY